MASATQSWSVIIFCYNEAGTVRHVVESVQGFFERAGCNDNEIIIVDDGSTDGSTELIREAEKKYANVRAIYHGTNRGIGHALRSGYWAASKENVTALPADGQFNTDELLLFANISPGTFVSFFRKENTVYSMRRNVLSYINKKLNSILLSIDLKDVNWVKVYKQEELSKLKLVMTSSLVESEICSKLILRNNKAIEVNSIYQRRSYGESKGASRKIVMQAMRETLKLIWVISLYKLSRRNRSEEYDK